jgi:D-glycero-alpha-D-manno-heptose-7-phosphate kinase
VVAEPRRRLRVHAPVRADLSAGFPDVAPFCQNAPGLVVNVALTLVVKVTLRRRAPGGGSGRGRTLPERLVDWTAHALHLDDAFDVEVRTPGLTPGSGLGSSGALSVAVVHGLLSEVLAAPPSSPEVADLAIRAERAAGIHGGTQDQWASACGGLGVVRQLRATGERIPIPIPRELPEWLALVHPGGARDSGTIVRAVTAGAESVRARAVIAAMNDLAEGLVEALGAGDIPAVARLVAESRALQTALHPSIVSAAMSEVLARGPGVGGAKPCGAGGDSATWIALVDPARRREFDDYARSRGLTVVAATSSATGVRTVE